MSRMDRIRQQREMHRRIRAVVAERRSSDRARPFGEVDDEEEPTVDPRGEREAAR
jgi:hypothetical protein